MGACNRYISEAVWLFNVSSSFHAELIYLSDHCIFRTLTLNWGLAVLSVQDRSADDQNFFSVLISVKPKPMQKNKYIYSLLLPLSILTLGAHAQEGYCSCLACVCVSVCLSVCLLRL